MDVRNTAFTEITRTLQILPKLLVNLAIIKVVSRIVLFRRSDSHLLLSWAGSGCCDRTPDIGQTQLRLSLLRRESRAAVLPPPLVLLDKQHYWMG